MRKSLVMTVVAGFLGLMAATPVQALTKKATSSCDQTVKDCQSRCRGEYFCMAHCQAAGCSGDWYLSQQLQAAPAKKARKAGPPAESILGGTGTFQSQSPSPTGTVAPKGGGGSGRLY